MNLRTYAKIIEGHDIAGADAAAELAEDALIRYLRESEQELTDMGVVGLKDLVKLSTRVAMSRGMVETSRAMREIADTIDD